MAGDKGKKDGGVKPPLQRARVLSGMRPTGKLHIGHYFGALQNWARLQNDPAYECFYFIADWHALTSDYADTSAVAQNAIEIVTDYLASGLDPKKCTIFQQSLIPEHAELHLLLSMVTPLGWLERVPTYKEALENIKDKDLHTYGFLGYPVLQCGDITMYSNPGARLFVPTGEDQVSHVETSREVVHKFNFHFGLNVNLKNAGPAELGLLFRWLDWAEGKKDSVGFQPDPVAFDLADMEARIRRLIVSAGFTNAEQKFQEFESKAAKYPGVHGAFQQFVQRRQILVEPESMVTSTPRIPGLDGRKMSKSYGNAITLSESDADIRAKTKVMVTDPARKRRTDPGNPDVCPVYDWHKLFSTPETLKWAADGCRTAGIGCIECKAKMADHLIEWITPVRERRVEFERHPARVLEVIDEGSKRARVVAQGTMERVREAVFGWEKKRAEIRGGGKQAASGE